jgi:hypothetical protein
LPLVISCYIQRRKCDAIWSFWKKWIGFCQLPESWEYSLAAYSNAWFKIDYLEILDAVCATGFADLYVIIVKIWMFIALYSLFPSREYQGMKETWSENSTLQNTSLCGKYWMVASRARLRFNGLILPSSSLPSVKMDLTLLT